MQVKKILPQNQGIWDGNEIVLHSPSLHPPGKKRGIVLLACPTPGISRLQILSISPLDSSVIVCWPPSSPMGLLPWLWILTRISVYLHGKPHTAEEDQCTGFWETKSSGIYKEVGLEAQLPKVIHCTQDFVQQSDLFSNKIKTPLYKIPSLINSHLA